MENFKKGLVKEAEQVIEKINNTPMVEVECDTKVFGVINTKLKNIEVYSNDHFRDEYLGTEGLLNPNIYNEMTQGINTVQKTYGMKLLFENGDEMQLHGCITVIGENEFKGDVYVSRMGKIRVTQALSKKFNKMSMEDIIKKSYSQLKLKSIKKQMK